MPIKIFNRQHKIKLNLQKIYKYLSQVGNKLRLSKTTICNIIFIDDREIKKINKKYRNTSYSTDVLSFSYSSKNADIFISVETARSNAIFYRQEFYTEILRLIIHGILHFLDFTDYSKKTKEKMWKKQEQILKCLLK